MAAAESSSASRLRWFEPCVKDIRQGDIAFCEFHQLRARSGEGPGPGKAEHANEDLPYLGPFEDFQLDVTRPDGTKVQRVARVWSGFVVVLHQNCEIKWAHQNDSRLLIAPLVTPAMWPHGEWDLFRAGNAPPGFLYVPEMSSEEAGEISLPKKLEETMDLPADWSETVVALGSSTVVSRGMLKRERLFRIGIHALPKLQEAMVRYSTVRGWASTSEASAMVGMTVVDAQDTSETVMGPSRVMKIFLRDDEGGDEISVAWGLRHSR